ncbi:NAD(P)-binding protein [Rhizodiscina lignyota]|uniref:NAD(P)-binding protein n=1 Tax=Rhizodiscina lignyota TaxID=1504668 RepID=A0A9P4IN13_9PEZI|nr:NAD(P)-binding protein [Rhizodiscina lignyota]
MSAHDQEKYLNKLKGANVLVIGGTSGIGFAVAEASLEYGAFVTVSSSNPERVHKAVAELQAAYPSRKDRVKGYECDLGEQATLDANMRGLLERVVDDTGRKIDHVVHTAGGGGLLEGKLAEMGPGDILGQPVMTRFFAPLMLAKHAPEYMSPGPRSSITLTSGVIAMRPMRGGMASIQSAFAAGLIGMTKGMAMDLAPMRVNLVLPGPVDTPLYDPLPEAVREGMKAQVGGTTLTKRFGRPEDLAESYLACMKDENLTGASLETNGGISLV